MRPFLSVVNTESFFKYYGRFLARLRKDATPWARDNIGFAALMLVAPPLAVYLRDPSHPIDWGLVKTTLWIYLVALGIYVGYHAVRTPWKLSLEPAKPPTVGLDVSIRELAESVLDFIYERVKHAPLQPQSPYTSILAFSVLDPKDQSDYSQAHAAFNKYERETLDVYGYKFARRVVAAVTELRKLRESKSEMQTIWGNPKSSEEIKQIGASLMKAADKLVAGSKGNIKTLDKG